MAVASPSGAPGRSSLGRPHEVSICGGQAAPGKMHGRAGQPGALRAGSIPGGGGGVVGNTAGPRWPPTLGPDPLSPFPNYPGITRSHSCQPLRWEQEHGTGKQGRRTLCHPSHPSHPRAPLVGRCYIRRRVWRGRRRPASSFPHSRARDMRLGKRETSGTERGRS